MGELFFGTQLVKLMKTSICRYDAGSGNCQNFGENKDAYTVSQEQQKIFEKYFSFQRKEYPSIHMLEADVLVAEIAHPDLPEVWSLFGPVLLAPASEKCFSHADKKYRVLRNVGMNLQMCELETFVTGILLCYHFVTGKEMQVAEFWERNEESMPKVLSAREEMTKNLFRYQEKDRVGLHNPYEQEQREQEAIRHGDIVALNRSISETYEGQIGRLAKDPLRHHKNVAVGNITLASRTAVEAGVSVEKSFTMADNFIQQIEEIDNVAEVEAFKREAQRLYASAVAEEQKSETGGYKNPLIVEVKDYIFRHFHDSIQITDIAKHLNVNPDYLSHLFKKQENITIKRYILKEKIRTSRNLLQYSDYTIQEISFYLGFSSQSHFCKVFQEMTGETPGRYRKQFVHRTKWKIV